MAIIQVGTDGKAPSSARVGDVVRTAGGDYEITGGSAGAWKSKKLNPIEDLSNISNKTKPSVIAAIQSTKTGGSAGVKIGEDWQRAMVKTFNGGAAAIGSEIARAEAVVKTGSGSEATLRYLSQLNALKDGAKLGDVMAGKYDSYGYRGSDPAAPAVVAPPPVVGPDLWGGITGGSGAGAYGAAAAVYDEPYDNRTVGQAVQQGMAAIMPDFSGMANTGIMVIAGAAVLVAFSKLLGSKQ